MKIKHKKPDRFFTKGFLDKLQKKINLLSVIAPLTHIHEADDPVIADCPFHSDKGGTLIFNRKGRHYFCYECEAHGDAISFLMTHKLMTFNEAVLWLAKLYKIKPEYVKKGYKVSDYDKKALIKSLMEKLR